MPVRTASDGIEALKQPRLNERWRVALAGLATVLAIPILVIDNPSSAEGVVESAAADVVDVADIEAPVEDVAEAPLESADLEPPDSVGDRVLTVAAEPNLELMSAMVSSWQVARSIAVEEGLVDLIPTPPPSDTNLALLPRYKVTLPDPEPEPETDPEGDGGPDADSPVDPEPDPDPDPGAGDPDPDPDVGEPDPEPDPDAGDPDPDAGEPDPEPDPDPEPEPEPEPGPSIPDPPAQVNGRVPPPEGGPTAAQWDAVRKCESTHNYQAISPSGLYRGAYQFSQQTWDWVSGIHWPFLVGIDPIDAPPGWQDVMAYTLYAMRGWDQWPICGKNLL